MGKTLEELRAEAAAILKVPGAKNRIERMMGVKSMRAGQDVRFVDLPINAAFRLRIDDWLEMRKKDRDLPAGDFIKISDTTYIEASRLFETGTKNIIFRPRDATRTAKRGFRVEFLALA